MDDLLTDAVERLLAAECTTGKIRTIEATGDASALWRLISQAGFADALLAEDRGGAGLGLADIFGVVLACGRHVVPVPLSLTMLVKALLAEAGLDCPDGMITVAPSSASSRAGGLVCARVPYGRVATFVLVPVDGAWHLLDTASGSVSATGVYGSLEADIEWSTASPLCEIRPATDVTAAAAALMAAQIAGALDAVFARTIVYANDRSQFGKPIGKFQAIQHQISIIAENVFVAGMAAEIGCSRRGPTPDPLLAALAKLRTSEAVAPITSIAHAVHGAIGITEEFDLQLFTRRLHEWRAAYGTESFWSRKIGAAVLQDGAEDCLGFMRKHLFPARSQLGEIE